MSLDLTASRILDVAPTTHKPARDSDINNLGTNTSQGRVTSAIGAIVDWVQPAVDRAGETTRQPRHGWIVRTMNAEGPAILRMLWRILRCEADVMDAYQDCFCKLARADASKLVSARAYVYRTATNIAIEMLRHRTRRRNHLPTIAENAQTRQGEQSPGMDRTNSSDESDSLGRALARLPAHLRNVVIARDFCRHPYKEVAKLLGIDAATARVYRRHAVVKLSELMKEEGAEDAT